ncbi:P-loop containing nucleoside triphosphate hydrolase protein [Martensiomyces pterosporus]|nr:P-loop containing nucleoside triphosphate hydrolase protein [Martensiomyces pterosporus]
MNVKIISGNQTANQFLLTADEEAQTLQRHRENKDRLKVPRRPAWDSTTSAAQLHRSEREAFMNWRRDLAHLQEEEGLLLTPFERNLEVWRQLWRVLERSHLVVQIVDARNPMLFRSSDLVDYVHEIDERKKCLLLINKADMLTERQRETWAKYYEGNGIRYLFFSAKESNEKLEQEKEREEAEKLARELNQHKITDEEADELLQREQEAEAKMLEEEAPLVDDFETKIKSINLSDADLRTRVLSPAELVSLLMKECPKLADEHSHNRLMIGLVGYPNVGKSSTINALVGSKKVNVGSMPGKTKHFQTIHLTSDVVLCDCPGLVFPTFATTQADMVCNGVLPIDQLREFTGPSGLVAQRIPKWVLEAIYGIEIKTRHEEEGGTGIPTAEELLTAYAAARGMFKGGEGNPDESRAARILLKDYVNGKLVYCHPPPDHPDAAEFNEEHYDPATVAKHTRHLVETTGADGSEPSYTVKHAASDRRNVKKVVFTSGSVKVEAVDRQFFTTGQALVAAQRHSSTHKVTQGNGYAQMQVGAAARSYVNDRGEALAVSGVEVARQAGLAQAGKPGKKHKRKKAGKQRSGDGVYEYY